MKIKVLEIKRRNGINQVEEHLDKSGLLQLLNKNHEFSKYRILLRVPIRLKGSVGYMTVPSYISIKGNDVFSIIQCNSSIFKILFVSLLGAFVCTLPFLLIYQNLIGYFISAFFLFFILYFYFINQLTKRVSELIRELKL